MLLLAGACSSNSKGLSLGAVGGSGPGGTTAGGGTTACSYDADCGPGRACRSIGGSNLVCMGQGAAGDYCYYDADCMSQSCAPANGAMYCR